MSYLIRDDGAILPYSKAMANRPGFRVVNGDPRDAHAAAAPLVLPPPAIQAIQALHLEYNRGLRAAIDRQLNSRMPATPLEAARMMAEYASSTPIEPVNVTYTDSNGVVHAACAPIHRGVGRAPHRQVFPWREHSIAPALRVRPALARQQPAPRHRLLPGTDALRQPCLVLPRVLPETPITNTCTFTFTGRRRDNHPHTLVKENPFTLDAVSAWYQETGETEITRGNVSRFIRYVDQRAAQLLRDSDVKGVVAPFQTGPPRPARVKGSFLSDPDSFGQDAVTAAWLRQLNLDQAVARYIEVFGYGPSAGVVDRRTTASRKASRVRLIIMITEATTNLRYPQRDSLDGPLEEG